MPSIGGAGGALIRVVCNRGDLGGLGIDATGLSPYYRLFAVDGVVEARGAVAG